MRHPPRTLGPPEHQLPLHVHPQTVALARRAAALRRRGFILREIGDVLGLTKQRVLQLIEINADLTAGLRTPYQDRQKRLRTLVKLGWSTEEIANDLGLGVRYVRQLVALEAKSSVRPRRRTR